MKQDQHRLAITTFFIILIFVTMIATGCLQSSPQGYRQESHSESQAPQSTPKPVTLVAFTAASLKGASDGIGPAFSNATPVITVKFNLDGTQALKQQIENGARADVFISASNTYTNALKSEGFLINETVKPLAYNYIIVIVPAGNPGNITSLADLGTPGKKIAMGTPEVPVGVNTRQAIAKLANSSFNSTWNSTLFQNVVSYETQEPGVVTKVALGEVDAGFVYESSYKAAKPGTLKAISIPIENNALQTYTIGILNTTSDQEAAQKFVDFMLSSEGQQVLAGYGFRAAGP
jgi:molybdate transport system substrate-binding protein